MQIGRCSMVVHHKNSRFAVVDDDCPGLKIWDIALDRRATGTGGFYDNMGAPYHPDALAAAKQCADRLERYAGAFRVEASDGSRTQSVRCRSLCRAIRTFENVILDGNVCEAFILDH